MWSQNEASVVVQIDFWFADPPFAAQQVVELVIHRMEYRREPDATWTYFRENAQPYLRGVNSPWLEHIFSIVDGRIGKPMIHVNGFRSTWEGALAMLDHRRSINRKGGA